MMFPFINKIAYCFLERLITVLFIFFPIGTFYTELRVYQEITFVKCFPLPELICYTWSYLGSASFRRGTRAGASPAVPYTALDFIPSQGRGGACPRPGTSLLLMIFSFLWSYHHVISQLSQPL